MCYKYLFIELATDGGLASENWSLNMEICDMINDTEEGPKDAIKAIRKRLLQNAGKNHKVIMYTLTVSVITNFVITNYCLTFLL